MADLNDLCDGIAELGVHRRATVKMMTRLTNQMKSLLRRHYGWSAGLPEKERNAISRRAAKICGQLMKGEATDEEVPDIFKADAVAFQRAFLAIFERRKVLDAHMIRMAKHLPAYDWVEGVRGVAAMSMAELVAEAGNLSAYANPGKLWKRLGLAPYQGKACSTWNRPKWRNAPALSAAEWTEAAYCPRRYSAMWNIGECLIKAGGDYKALYDRRKAIEASKEGCESKLHAHNRARRYIVKRFVRDLWTEWRQAIGQPSCEYHGTCAVA